MPRLICIALGVFISGSCFAQSHVLQPRELSKLLPVKIKGWPIKGDSKSNLLTIGTLRYSLCERTFASRDNLVKVLLFDYAEAPIMLNQSVKKWSEMPETQTDSITFESTKTDFGQAWESSHPRTQRAQLLLEINNRFFLTLEAESLTLEELRKFFSSNFDLSKFPK
ncbi:MAG TPA: hypothetical protein VGD40_17270 [Chryseosolibacter sp.]